jgi:hypothetical protein
MSVNGVIQTPITDYTVSASSVTFTESYPSGSKINARYLVAATNSSDVNLANIVLTGTTTGDAYYPQVAALLHFDGTNGSTTITDNSKNNFTLTVVGNAQISTAQSKFGGSSLYLDGTGDRLTIASPTTDLSFGTGDFTIETWVYKTVASTALILDARATADAIPWIVVINSSNFPYFYDGTQYVSTVSITLNSWVHLAVVRTSGVLKIFVNGVQGYSAAHSVNLNRTAGLIIGDSVGLVNAYAGYIDEIRITNGYARYTGNFTPSTTAFSNTGGDVGKALVVNSTATGVSIGTAGYFSSQLAKAWVNFNGTGTVAIRDSYNVSSITDIATGEYYVNYSTAFSNANYCAVATAGRSTAIANPLAWLYIGGSSKSTTRLQVEAINTSNAYMDPEDYNVLVFSN